MPFCGLTSENSIEEDAICWSPLERDGGFVGLQSPPTSLIVRQVLRTRDGLSATRTAPGVGGRFGVQGPGHLKIGAGDGRPRRWVGDSQAGAPASGRWESACKRTECARRHRERMGSPTASPWTLSKDS